MQFSTDPAVLRLVTLIPGTIAIMTSFAAGRRAGGGLAAAFFLAAVAKVNQEAELIAPAPLPG